MLKSKISDIVEDVAFELSQQGGIIKHIGQL